MTIAELLETAESTYPPTQIVLLTACMHIGTPRKVANALKLGEHGRQRVRDWISGRSKIPFSCWIALIAMNEVDK